MHRFVSRGRTAVALALTGLGSLATPWMARAELVPRHVPEKPAVSRLYPGLRSDLLIVKFQEGASVRLRDGRLIASTGGVDLTAANQLLAARPDLRVERLFTRPEPILDRERADGQLRAQRALADLNNYYTVHLLAPSTDAAEQLLDALNALPEIEIAYAEPIPKIALLDEPKRSLLAPPTGTGPATRDGATPDFQGLQGYLNAAPTGVGATTAWTFTGGRGAGVKIIDVEVGWNWTHEDMKVPFYREGVEEYGDHGVAVIGEIASKNNGFGTTGIASDVEIGCHDVSGIPTADVFNLVSAALAPGDIFVIELHCPGPASGGGGQFGYIALEYWQANFDAIAQATALGVLCCEAAGNGEQDFDDPLYTGRFDRSIRDSGAIIVGATNGSALDAAWFTNYGSRVDLAGWGFNVTTCGYGDLQGGSQNQWYTSGFSGTSSATPIITGAVASLQGAYKAASGGVPLPGGTLAQVLKQTGTPTNPGPHIGPRPNLAAAIPLALTSLSRISGTVRENGSGTPIAGADAWILETGTRTTTAANGSYLLPITAGTWTVRVRHFGHATNVASVTTSAGGTTTHDVSMAALSLGTVHGTVVDPAGQPIANATVTLEGTPLPSTTTALDGTYAIPGVPFGHNGLVSAVRSDLTPDVRQVSAFGFSTTVDFRLAQPITFESSNGSFTGTGEWEWGVPTYAFGPDAHSPIRCWGTNLDGDYSLQTHRLTSPVFDLDGMVEPRLAFWEWYSIWGPYDGAMVEISTNGGSTWTVLPPVGGYPDPCIDALPGTGPCRPGFTGSSGDWVPGVFDLGAYADQEVRFRFTLGSYGFSGAPGWYIDDLQVHGENSAVAVESATPVTRPMLGAIAPSPTRGAASVTLTLAAPADATLRIYDAAGREIRTLASGTMSAGPHVLAWDGADAQGRAVGSGVYFLTVETREGDAVSRWEESRRVVIVP